jgi:hypothetical protein
MEEDGGRSWVSGGSGVRLLKEKYLRDKKNVGV